MSITPTLHYDDADAALAWLTANFALVAGRVERDGFDFIWHAELWQGQDVIFIGSTPAEHLGKNRVEGFARAGIHITLPNREQVDRHHDRAAERGTRILCEPTDTPYGTYEYWAADLEGNTWMFSTYGGRPLSTDE